MHNTNFPKSISLCTKKGKTVFHDDQSWNWLFVKQVKILAQFPKACHYWDACVLIYWEFKLKVKEKIYSRPCTSVDNKDIWIEECQLGLFSFSSCSMFMFNIRDIPDVPFKCYCSQVSVWGSFCFQTNRSRPSVDVITLSSDIKSISKWKYIISTECSLVLSPRF